MASLKERFGQRLREIRQERRMTQEQFAELLGISVGFLSLVERGNNAPSFEMLEKTQEQFAELLGISDDFLSLIERGITPSFENLEIMGRKLRMPLAALFTFDDGKLP